MKAGALVWLASSMIGAALTLTTPVSVIQQGGAKAGATIDPAVFKQGRQLYEANGVACHQAGGVGTPPNPALNDNDWLIDVDQVVRTIRLGRGGMLAFPELTAGEIAAVVTYVRNAWSNTFGAATIGQVETVLAELAAPAGGQKVSVWSGVYTAAQNKRGEEVHSAACAQCHGLRLNGACQPDMPPSPAIARATFLRKWADQTVATLFVYVRTKMPPDNPGTITDQQSIDAIAHMFAVSDIAAGDKELQPDPKVLEGIVINAQKK